MLIHSLAALRYLPPTERGFIMPHRTTRILFGPRIESLLAGMSGLHRVEPQISFLLNERRAPKSFDVMVSIIDLAFIRRRTSGLRWHFDGFIGKVGARRRVHGVYDASIRRGYLRYEC